MLKKSAWLLLCVLYLFSVKLTLADTVAANTSSAVPATPKLAVPGAASAVVPVTSKPTVPIDAKAPVSQVSMPDEPTAAVPAVQTTVKSDAPSIAKPAEHTIAKVSEHPVVKHAEPAVEKPTLFTSIKAALPTTKADAEAVPASTPDATSPQTDFPVLFSDTEILSTAKLGLAPAPLTCRLAHLT